MRKVPILTAVMRSSLYPGVIQIPTLIVFVGITYTLFTSTGDPAANVGSTLTWLLWWPILTLTYVLIGRIWCLACPMGFLSDIVQKVVGNHWTVPKFIKDYGLFLMTGLLIVLTWAAEYLELMDSPVGTGAMLFAVLTGVIVAGSFFERRTWCRHLCPLGGMSGIYSKMGMVKLKADPDKCRTCETAGCIKGGEKPQCPFFENPRTMDGMNNCNYCAYCVKNCPNDSMQIQLGKPSSEVWSVRAPRVGEAFVATSLIGVVAMMNTGDVASHWIDGFLGLSDQVAYTAFYFMMVAIPTVLLLVGGAFSSSVNKTSAKHNYALFGYTLIPVTLLAHLAHHLDTLEEGKLVLFSVMEFFGFAVAAGSSPEILDGDPLFALRMVVIGLGVVISAYAAWKTAKAEYGDKALGSAAPVLVIIGIVFAYNGYLMSMGAGH